MVYTLLLSILLSVGGDEPTPGRISMVTCRKDATQKYACYLPRAYDKKRAWPILYCFSPNARGDIFVERYAATCEERGWIVVGSMNSKNGDWAPIEAAVEAMWTDTEARFKLASKMRYVSGFSGGARVSFHLSEHKKEHVAGIIAIGAGLAQPNGKLPHGDLNVFLCCGTTDFNCKEMEALSKRFDESGHEKVFKIFQGGHTLPSEKLMADAVRWLDDQSAPRRLELFREGLASIKKKASSGETVGAYVALLAILTRPSADKSATNSALALQKTLEKDKNVKRELTAQRLLKNAEQWLEKNKSRIEKSRTIRGNAAKRFRKIAKRFGDLPTGKRAAKRAEEVNAGGMKLK